MKKLILCFVACISQTFAALVPLTKTVNGVELPLYVLRVASTKVVINQRALSNTTGIPNPGTDQEYLPILIDTQPNNDPTYTIVTQKEAPNEATHQWWITFVVTDRPQPEKLLAVDNAKRLAASKVVPSTDLTETLVLAIAAILRELKGIELTPDEVVLKEKLIASAVALKANLDTANAKKTAVESGGKPDLATGWVDATGAVVVP